jgi:GxxExxY protein
VKEPLRHGGTEISELNAIAHAVMGAAVEVHRALGPGLLEALYERALSIELDERRIAYELQARFPAFYKGRMLGTHRIDFIVEGLVLVEVKSVAALSPIFDAQVLSYLRLSGKKVGLLINFNSAVLKEGIRRLIV